MMNSAFRPAQKDIELAQPPSDSISKIEFSPTQDFLAVASWDNHVRIYGVTSQGENEPKAMYSHQAPVLDLCWSKDGSRIFSSGCDNQVLQYTLSTSQAEKVAEHSAPIKCVRYVEISVGGQPTQMIITAGWDKALKYWDVTVNKAQKMPPHTLELTDRAYAMDATDRICVVGTADRQVSIYDLSNPGVKLRQVESPLKWQTRVISCFPPSTASNENGYAIGSIEGRVGFQFTHGNDTEKKSFSFKCHRVDIPSGSITNMPAGMNGQTGQLQNVFAINDITFHKDQGTFCTAGGDGTLTFWDGMARTKVKTFSDKDLGNGDSQARPPQWGLPIVSTTFNHDGSVLAYALSYDWSKGHNGVPPASANPTRIMLHAVKPDEVQRKKR